MDKYKKNLKIQGEKVLSYNTHVATINHAERTILQLGWWSQTTQKHINYVCREFKYNLITKND